MSQPRTIAFFGSSLLFSQATPDAACLRGILQGLHQRGFQLTLFEPVSDDFYTQRWVDAGWIHVTSYPTDSELGLSGALQAAAAADIIIKSSQNGVVDERLNQSVLKVARPRTQVVFWDLDPAATLNRLSANPDDPFRTLIPKYDVILTLGGDASVTAAYQKLGARLCVPLSDTFDSCFAPAEKCRHWVRELDVILRPASLQSLPA